MIKCPRIFKNTVCVGARFRYLSSGNEFIITKIHKPGEGCQFNGRLWEVEIQWVKDKIIDHFMDVGAINYLLKVDAIVYV